MIESGFESLNVRGAGMTILKTTFYCVLLLCFDIHASNADSGQVLRFEASPFRDAELNCDFDDNITPRPGDFVLNDYAIMSSDYGNRYGIVSIKNTSSGQRILNETYIVAIFGDCVRRLPALFSKTFSGNEQITITIPFGFNRFPILKLYMGERK